MQKLKRLSTVENRLPQRTSARKLQMAQSTVYRQVKKIGHKRVNKLVCHKMFAKTVRKRRKCFWPLYLMLRKGRYKTWITSDEALFHPSSITDETNIESFHSKSVAKTLKSCYFAKRKLAIRLLVFQGLTKPKSKTNAK
ncbi:hypothetical protein TNCV_4638821 [Trichonephila clavipes]|uniref:Uncharacterized protein n=1 Tax=Trichonephila clavipes TaxID=2585209 RepID=A0A8X7BI98_TRICX|nr:hypothetical protein TNCV_4638821 [Trichonephila clavipes]